MNYLFSENKGADQLHVYHAVDRVLRLYFHICKNQVFLMTQLNQATAIPV